jgi:hypothetical protein
VNVLQGWADLFDEQASGIGERDAARRPIEQADAKVCLKLADGIAERGGRHAQFERRGTERRLARYSDNRVEIVQT